jgi:hypothetical protein
VGLLRSILRVLRQVRAARPGERYFDEMLDACEALALEAGAHQLRASVNFAREQEHQKLVLRGFQPTESAS